MKKRPFWKKKSNIFISYPALFSNYRVLSEILINCSTFTAVQQPGVSRDLFGLTVWITSGSSSSVSFMSIG